MTDRTIIGTNPLPSNPTPLSAPQEQQVRDLYYKNVRAKCATEIETFAQCALGRTFTMIYACRESRLLMNSCMLQYQNQDELDKARREWFALAGERRKVLIPSTMYSRVPPLYPLDCPLPFLPISIPTFSPCYVPPFGTTTSPTLYIYSVLTRPLTLLSFRQEKTTPANSKMRGQNTRNGGIWMSKAGPWGREQKSWTPILG
jgi:hypothetical protein